MIMIIITVLTVLLVVVVVVEVVVAVVVVDFADFIIIIHSDSKGSNININNDNKNTIIKNKCDAHLLQSVLNNSYLLKFSNLDNSL